MAIQDSDLFLIEDAGVSKKIRADKLKGGLDGTYPDMLLLVNKPDYSSCYVKCSDLQSNLPDDHWMMVERSSVSYKVSGADVHSYFPSGPAGATGVITDSHTTPINNGSTGAHDLTVASVATPNFADNEAIRMVDNNGDTASYVPVTSTITNVDDKTINVTASDPGSAWIVGGTPPLAINGDTSSYYNAQKIRIDFDAPIDGFFSHSGWGGGGTKTNTIKYYDENDNEIGEYVYVRYTEEQPYHDPTVRTNVSYYIGSTTASGVASDGNAWSALYVNGELITDSFKPSTILTFADPCPDLKFFQPGDVVQGFQFPSSATGGTTPYAGFGVADPLILFDDSTPVLTGYFSNTTTCLGHGVATDSDVMKFDIPFKSSGNLYVWAIAEENSGDLIANGDHVIPIQKGPTTQENWAMYDTGLKEISTLQFRGAKANNNVIACVQFFSLTTDISGRIGRSQQGAKVIYRDPMANTMVVNGGAWTGSDTTNSGDAADRETEVTGPSKSGTAKADGVPASTTFRIKDSNGEWIDNTNSNSGADHSGGSAQSFYVKNGSGRVSIQRLLEVAIAEATTWAAATGYAEGAFVEHDGVYWYALSSSYDNSPDDNDPLDWLRLS